MEISKCLGCMESFRGYPCPNCGYDPKKQVSVEYALPAETILAGKYLIGRLLGQGGFGMTYIGWDLALERKVAIKEYYPAGQVSRSPGTKNLTWYTSENAQSARQEGMQIFLKEGRKMAKLDRLSNVVRVLDLFQENETAYIVMDFVEGETLKARLQRTGPMDWEQAQEIFLPAIRAMEAVHKQGIIHRDLSPDNLMLAKDGSVQILDLGAAKDLNINTGASSMQVAKAGFSPWEQYTQRGNSGTWTDVYAMAATIYYTLTGKVPPNAMDRVDKDSLEWDVPALQALPAPALSTLKKAMAVTAEKRLQTMEELEKGLFGGTREKAAKPAEKGKGKNGSKAVAAIAAVALLCAGAFGVKYALDAKTVSRYQAAELLFADGKYPEAANAFDALGDYQDSAVKAAEARSQQELVDGYAAAQALLDEGKYADAAEAFDALGTYGDSSAKAAEARAGKEAADAYQAAQALLADGQYAQAASAFDALGDYRDSKENAAQARAQLTKESDYEEALLLLNTHQYEEAAAAFDALGDYQDSAAKAAEARHQTALAVGYENAESLLNQKRYTDAASAFEALGDYRDSAERAAEALRIAVLASEYDAGQSLLDEGKYLQALWAFSNLNYKDSQDKAQEAREKYIANHGAVVAAGDAYAVGLRSDGTVVAAGYNGYGQCDVSSWRNIVAVTARVRHTVGLRSDGTVVAVGSNSYGQCSVDSWKNIVAVAAGSGHTVGLQSNGTVVATGSNFSGQCNVSGWSNIVAVAAGVQHTVGLRSDGTVVAVGANTFGQCDVSSWKNIVAVAAGTAHTIGLRKDGTVVAVGRDDYSQCSVSNWKDIVAVAAGNSHTVGLRSDGTVVAVGYSDDGRCDVSSWKDIVAIAAGYYCTVGLRSDGTVVATEYSYDWKNIRTAGADAVPVKEAEAVSGVFTGHAQGMMSEIEAVVTIENGRIVDVRLTGPDETPGLGGRVLEEMPAKILAAQSADVDGMSGATDTTDGVKNAVREALAKAGLA